MFIQLATRVTGTNKDASGNSGPVTMTCWLERKGYAPGERVGYNVLVKNDSGGSVRVSARLKMVSNRNASVVFQARTSSFSFSKRTTYTVRSHKSKCNQIIWQHPGQLVSQPEFHLGPDGFGPLVVPDWLPPSGFPFCKLIDVHYSIQVRTFP